MDLSSHTHNISSRNIYNRWSHRHQSSISSNSSVSSTASKKSLLKRLFPAHWFHKKSSIPSSSLESIDEDNSVVRSKTDADSESTLFRSQSVLGFNSSLRGRKTKKKSKLKRSPPYGLSTDVRDLHPTSQKEPARPSTSLSFFEDVSFGPPFSADLILSSLPSSPLNSPLIKSAPASPYVNESSIEANQCDFYDHCEENFQTPDSSFVFDDAPSDNQTNPKTTKRRLGNPYMGVDDENARRFSTPLLGSLHDKTNIALNESTRSIDLKDEAASVHSINVSSLENGTCDPKLVAMDIWNGSEKIVSNEDALSYLMQDDNYHRRVLEQYISLYDFENSDILQSLRILCGNLYIKGETQKVDHLLEIFSSRWCHTNPKEVFCTKDIVHSVAFSILLLNTDLHIANIASSQKMTRSQFVSNTLSDILQALEASFNSLEDKYQFLLRSYAAASNPNDGSAAISSLSNNLSNLKGGLTKSHEKKNSKVKEIEAAFVDHWSLVLKEIYHSIKVSSILQPDRYLQAKPNSQQQIADDIFAHAKNFSMSDNVSLKSNKSASDGRLEDTITRPSSSLLFECNNDGVLLFHNRFEKAMRHQFPEAKRSKSAMGYFQASCPSPDLPSIVITLRNQEHTPPFYLPPHCKYGILRYLIRYSGKLKKKDVWMITLSILEKDILSLYSIEGEFKDLQDLDVSKIGNPILKTSIMSSVAHLVSLDNTGFRRTPAPSFYLETHSGKRLQFAATRLGEAQAWIEALNYWAARTSRIPLLGSVSNVDYGWSLCTGKQQMNDKDIKSSSHGERKYPKLSLKVWEPEPISGIPSQLSLIKQLNSFKGFSKVLSEASKKHEAIHLEMLVILSSQNKNTFRRGVENWKARSLYLKSTIFKVKVYISVLKKYRKLAED
ncbi:guanyl-nucleotide exchange factor [Schizosaccharomyces cryophilus OY26]|uniref:Guanyl-nucleotide exchange factor n=1 Tax=Schizosaccharomyces cryophilus (strain OY26 / ATCC MYA-4695 / CBS 11777 / NBRC 106824 / NRRL Y48691) TaxID=653667 RepID=S9X8L8_SCHCR|nr:guanyl-nucleotide exchange factor [Schizosaccharomyces cryophilus OY26]EPY50166.1 guanyl-nucleotide exchange factor [Schizosaccharomyces cryophilus OY26]